MENYQKTLFGVLSSDTDESKAIEESGKNLILPDNLSGFVCPKDTQVIVGRFHEGDENGSSKYRYGKVSFINNADNDEFEIVASDFQYSSYMKESDDSRFICPESCLLVGREHQGDENGNTRYVFRKFYVQKKGDASSAKPILIDTTDGKASVVTKKESSGEYSEAAVVIEGRTPEVVFYEPMYGRAHDGDEQADTTSYFAFGYCPDYSK